MGYKALNVKLSYEFVEMLPSTDTTLVEYHNFKKMFGEDGSVMFVGIQDSNIFKISEFNDFYDLTYQIKAIDGVRDMVSIARLFYLTRNDSLKKFDFKPVIKDKPKTQPELDSLKNLIYSLRFYDGLLFNQKTNVTLLMITLDKKKINSENRFKLIDAIKSKTEAFSKKYKTQVHYSGLPYIRTVTSKIIKNELILFTLLALLVVGIILFLYYRSFKAVFVPLLVVVICVIWVLGTVAIFGFEITILTGIIPPLIIIICTENCIFLINKYHFEYKQHGNKVKALSRIVQRVGFATLLTNATAATGFAAFIITQNKLLTEFGIVASLNIFALYIISLFLVPILFSYFPPPTAKQVKHLDNTFTNRIVKKIVFSVENRRKLIYIISVVVLVAGLYGITKLKVTGRMVDDIGKNTVLYQDLLFLEKNFKGVMPLEISIDTKKKKGVMSLSTLKKIDRLQDSLRNYPELSRPLSVVEVVKFAKQAFYNGDSSMYSLPNGNEMVFMIDYLPKFGKQKKTIVNSFIDSNLQVTRISVQMANIGTRDIQRIRDDLKPKIDSIFNPQKYDVNITGTSVVFLKGTDFLVSNLGTSLIFAIIMIAIIITFLFTSARIVIISLLANILPQIITAGMMGYIGISIKPSTILIFSIALGISIDNAILYLSRYRQQLSMRKWNIHECVVEALKETSFSMIYSSSVLFLGFSIFAFSSFGGTQSMGYLISLTLFIAMFCNLFLLPSLLLTFGKRGTPKSFKKPVLNILEEDKTDITQKELNLKNK
jgi:predicted RND superfamily exporter protein